MEMTLINLLNTHKVGGIKQLSSKNNDWIIDSRASHNMTRAMELLSKAQNITLCFVDCVIQDQTSRALIKVSEEFDRSFFFEQQH
ncbi:hypothetical protein CR513_06585, partial [Mucuna pruriens]